jgi:hypothetical protein
MAHNQTNLELRAYDQNILGQLIQSSTMCSSLILQVGYHCCVVCCQDNRKGLYCYDVYTFLLYSFIFSSIGPRLLRIGKPLFLSWKFSLLIGLGGCRWKMTKFEMIKS